MSRIVFSATLFASVVTVCVFATSAVAQERQRDQRSRSDQQRADQRDSQASSQQSRERDSQRRSKQDEQGRRVALEPAGWVRVGIDYDGDNRFDASRTIYYYDLVEAQRRSDQRRNREGTDQQSSRQSASTDQQSSRQLRKVSGEVTSLKTFRSSRGEQHRFARIETSKGQTVPVNLGSVEDLRRLDLQNGDQVTVIGSLARANDRTVLRAHTIQSGDQRIDVTPRKQSRSRQFSGTITSLRSTRMSGQNQEFQVARVTDDSGSTQTVVLGPKDRLSELGLRSGMWVSGSARAGRLNGQAALVAERIAANDQTVRIEQSLGRGESARRQGAQQQRQQ